MLSIGKLGQGQERYYLEAVAQGAEDYYVYAGELPGRWGGGGSASLNLSGEVAGADFTAVLKATDPRTGEPLGRRHAVGKVPGFDLTFSAPKSVSLLFALGDDELSRRMRDAHDAAVVDALGYLERTAGHGRRGHAGAERIRTTGFVAALFRHRTSRAGDPNLHTHVVIANRVLGVDGRWTALDAKVVYAQAKTAGTLYETSLRHELRDLGLTWTVASSGLAEIDGVPHEVRRAFSQRRQQIEQHLDEMGLSSAKAAQVATLETRTSKVAGVDADTLVGRWRQRAEELGFTPTVIAELLRVGRESRAIDDPDAVLAALLGPSGLTERSSSFGEREVLRAIANALPAGAPVAQVESLAARLLASPEVVVLSGQEQQLRGQDVMRVARTGGSRLVPFGASERRWSTRELLSLEQQLVTTAVAGEAAGMVAVEDEIVQSALDRRPHLNDEQRLLVSRVTTGRDRLVVVNAAAGSGKTTALDAVTDAYATAGVPVIGATLSAKAAGVLRDETGMPTFTVARLLLDLRDPRSGGLPPGSVLVIDEAGQVGTRALAELQNFVTAADGQLVLVGDLRQLPEIDAGGAFRGMVNRLAVVELQENHRQREPDEQRRLLELRSGDVAGAIASYDAAGRITRAETGEELREQLVADWLDAYSSSDDGAGVVMLGLTNRDVEDLNDRARGHLLRVGLVGPDEVIVGMRGFRVGDRVVTRQNDRRLGVLNGQRWTVLGADVPACELHLRDVLSGQVVRLPFAYAAVGADRLQHAYALTTSLAQGSTVDRAFVLGSDATYREAGYTAASRARDRTQLYIVSREPDEACEERHGRAHLEAAGTDPLVELTSALSRSGGQHLGLDTAIRLEPRYVDAWAASPERTRLLGRRAELLRGLAGGPADPGRRAASITSDLGTARAELAEATADRVAAEERTVARRWRLQARRDVETGGLERSAIRCREELWQERVFDLDRAVTELEHARGEYDAWLAATAPARLELLEVDRLLAAGLPMAGRELDGPAIEHAVGL